MRFTRTLIVASGLCIPAAAHADQVLYNSDFEAGIIDPGWGPTARLDQAGVFTRFMGRYSENTPTILNNSVSLTLPVPPGDDVDPMGHDYVLKFDFYAIDSWDGNATLNGPDLFEVYINSTNLFSYTFSNSAPGQTFPQLPAIGPSLLGFNSLDRDSIYRDITIHFSLTAAQQIIIKWRSNGLQGMQDESWGIDNVSVTSTVPTPGTLALLGLSGLAMAKRRRR